MTPKEIDDAMSLLRQKSDLLRQRGVLKEVITKDLKFVNVSFVEVGCTNIHKINLHGVAVAESGILTSLLQYNATALQDLGVTDFA